MTWVLRKLGILTDPQVYAPKRDYVEELEQQSIALREREEEPAARCRELDETIRTTVGDLLQMVPPDRSGKRE